MIEQEFLQVLAEHDDRVFLFDNEPIREKFNQAHQQLVPSAKTPAPSSRLLAATPVRSRTPATTVDFAFCLNGGSNLRFSLVETRRRKNRSLLEQR